MEILNDEEIQLKFLLGLPVHIEGIGDLYSPSLTEIVDMTELKYSQATSALLLDKKKLETQDDMSEYSNFQVVLSIIYHDSSFRELFFCGLRLHLGKEPFHHKEGFIYFDELSEESILTEEKFEYMRKLVTIANHLAQSEEDDYVAGNERARKLIEKIKEKKAEASKYQKKTTNLHSIISAVGWKARSFEFISRLNIYQLYNGLDRLSVIDNFDYVSKAVSAGTLSQKDANLPEIHWANIIKK